MDEHEFMVERFEEQRPRLRAVAFRMLGSAAEADDALQEAWLRVSKADATGVENPDGWLTTVTARVCLNMLRSRRTRHEEPLELRVPDPVVTREGIDPSDEAVLADSVGLALLVVLEMLDPAERLAFVLTTCSRCPSTRSLRWSSVLRRPLVSSRARRRRCTESSRRPTRTSHASARSSMPFSPLHGWGLRGPDRGARS